MSSDESKPLSRELQEPFTRIVSDYIVATYAMSQGMRVELADACRRFFESVAENERCTT